MIEFLTTEGGDDSPEIQVLEGALDSYNDRFGPHHPLVLEVVERLALAWWREGEIVRALGLLDRTIQTLPEGADTERADLLGLVWKIFFEQRQFESALNILSEVLACRIQAGGPFHPDSLAAQGDLAVVLWQMARNSEAEALIAAALSNARAHLGAKDRVTCIIAWNTVLAAERRDDPKTACRIAAENLLWLLDEDPALLDPDLREIREWLAGRFLWDNPPLC